MLQKQIPFKAWSHHLTRFLPPAKRRGQMMLLFVELRLLAFLGFFTTVTMIWWLILFGWVTFWHSARILSSLFFLVSVLFRTTPLQGCVRTFFRIFSFEETFEKIILNIWRSITSKLMLIYFFQHCVQSRPIKVRDFHQNESW